MINKSVTKKIESFHRTYAMSFNLSNVGDFISRAEF